MPKFTFHKLPENASDSEVRIDFETDSLEKALGFVHDFMKGAGFEFPADFEKEFEPSPDYSSLPQSSSESDCLGWDEWIKDDTIDNLPF